MHCTAEAGIRQCHPVKSVSGSARKKPQPCSLSGALSAKVIAPHEFGSVICFISNAIFTPLWIGVYQIPPIVSQQKTYPLCQCMTSADHARVSPAGLPAPFNFMVSFVYRWCGRTPAGGAITGSPPVRRAILPRAFRRGLCWKMWYPERNS